MPSFKPSYTSLRALPPSNTPGASAILSISPSIVSDFTNMFFGFKLLINFTTLLSLAFVASALRFKSSVASLISLTTSGSLTSTSLPVTSLNTFANCSLYLAWAACSSSLNISLPSPIIPLNISSALLNDSTLMTLVSSISLELLIDITIIKSTISFLSWSVWSTFSASALNISLRDSLLFTISSAVAASSVTTSFIAASLLRVSLSIFTPFNRPDCTTSYFPLSIDSILESKAFTWRLVTISTTSSMRLDIFFLSAFVTFPNRFISSDLE